MIKKRHAAKGAFVGLLAAGLTATTLATAPSANAALGTRSLATVLAQDKGFDHNRNDFDILERVVGRVLAAKPSSAVSVLANGNAQLTAFLPTDEAFRLLVKDLSGKTIASESGVYQALFSVSASTLEAVLLYHVVPGKRLNAAGVANSDGKTITTAGGGSFVIDFRGKQVFLVDRDPDDADPRVVAVNINAGNKQIAHGISRVLRPINL